MRAAAVVVVGNAYLGDRARAAGARNVVELPSVVDLDQYPSVPQRTSESSPLLIGWMGTPQTDPFLEIVAEPLRSVCRRYDARFLCVGSTRSLPGVPTAHAEWSEESESRTLGKMNVGIMPLSDTRFTRGKCGYKLIQYMAAGLPVVASPVGVNRSIVQDQVNGFLADSGPAWETALATLLSDGAMRERMGAAGRRLVEKQYSTAVAAPILAGVLRTAARAGTAGARR
jgi:glycosyltransferase involved in cell wall biosynthesis